MTLLSSAARAAYVHLPFCRRRCFYCDFPVVVVGDAPAAADSAAERYVELLQREILAGPAPLREAPLRSLYFGGGTPSLTPPQLLHGVVDALRARFGLAPSCEVTIEMDPGTFDAARLAAFVRAGVTRVSLGVQSFDDALLTACGRAHSVSDAEQALRLLLNQQRHPAEGGRRALDISVDLIGGLPGQTMESWEQSLERAAACGAQHVSVYDLQVEPRTAFGKWFAQDKLSLPSEEVAAQMFRTASQVLRRHGFDHYEVSSFARPGHRCVHNRAYWRNEPFYAYGMGAASHLDRRRFARPRTMPKYSRYVEELVSQGWDAVNSAQGVQELGYEALTTGLMLALRTDAGVSFDELHRSYSDSGLGAIAAAACLDAASELPSTWVSIDTVSKTGHLSESPDQDSIRVDAHHEIKATFDLRHQQKSFAGAGQHMRLTQPEGFLFSNEAISTIFARIDDYVEKAGLRPADDQEKKHGRPMR